MATRSTSTRRKTAGRKKSTTSRKKTVGAGRKRTTVRRKKTAPASRKTTARKTTARKTASRKTTARKKSSSSGPKKTSSRKYSPAAAETVREEMHEFKRGTARSGRKGGKVQSREEAIAIGLSEARRAGKKVPPAPKQRGRKKST